jgi:hypothetical protein
MSVISELILFLGLPFMKKLVGVFMVTLFLSSCAPEIGSEKWCADMKEKSKADWTATQAKDFAKHCIF